MTSIGRRPGWPRGFLIAALIVSVALFALYNFLQTRNSTIAFTPSGEFRLNGEYPSSGSDAVAGPRWGSWSGNDANTGSLISAPFIAPQTLALTIDGYPNHPGESIELADATRLSERTRLNVGPDAGEAWSPRMIRVPADWRGRTVRLIAVDSGKLRGDWIGLADLRPASQLERVLSATIANFGLLIVMLMIAVLIVPPAVCAATAIGRHNDDAGIMTFALTMSILGLTAEVAFFATRTAPALGSLSIATILIAGWLFTAFALARKESRRRIVVAGIWMPWLVVLGIGILYGMVVLQTTPSGGDVIATVTNSWWKFPPDNVLPDLLAHQVAAGLPPRPFVGDWLSSDRPPLQSGFDLLTMWMFPGGSALDGVRYEALALWLQCWCFGALLILGRACGFNLARCLFAVGCCASTGFFFINSIYTWPKLITVAFGAAAIGVAFCSEARRRPILSYGLAGILFGLGMLAHNGVAFTLPALAVASVIALRSAAFKPLLASFALLLAVVLPWLAYQHFVDPPGDRLVKWHIGGQIPIDTSRSALQVITAAYESKAIPEVLEMKAANLQKLFQIYSSRRASEFFAVAWAVGILWVPAVWLLFLRRPTQAEGKARNLLAIGLGSTLIWSLMMWQDTVVHQSSYLSMALLMFPAALMAARSRITASVVAIVLLLDFGTTWILDVVPTADVAIDGILVVVACAALYWSFTRPAANHRGATAND